MNVKKLYKVQAKIDIVLMLDNTDQRYVNREVIHLINFETLGDSAVVSPPVEITQLAELPPDWDGTCLPWCGDGEQTIEMLLAENDRQRSLNLKPEAQLSLEFGHDCD